MSTTEPVEPSQAAERRASGLASRLGFLFSYSGLFISVVVIPTLVATGFFTLLAADRYVSESRFVVRNPQRVAPSGLGSLLQGTVFSRSQDDTYSVHDYIRSRDALRELDRAVDMRAAYSSSHIDFWNRFPGLDGDDSAEALHKHYQDHVQIEYDSVSSISVLRVRAYTAENAQKINDLLLQMGERLVNNLNTRSREDLIKVAEQEVMVAESRVKAAATALTAFRSGNRVFDPERQSAMQMQVVGKLQEEYQAVQDQLAQLKQVAPGNPQVAVLTASAERLRRSIAEQTSRLLGERQSLSAKSPAFDRLLLAKTIAERQLASALAALDSSRNDALRKQLYLERLVQPNLPDVATEPRRLRASLTVFVVSLLSWAVLCMVVASVREHSD